MMLRVMIVTTTVSDYLRRSLAKQVDFPRLLNISQKKKVCSNARSDFRAAMNGTRQSPWTYRHGLLTSYEYENLTAPLPIAFAQ